MKQSNLIGDISHLKDRDMGFRFDLKPLDSHPQKQRLPDVVPAFAVKFNDQIFAYLNICGHIAVQLDFKEGDFFDDEGENLVCATHGAQYAPDTGKCLGGPCYGVGLDPVDVIVEADMLYLNNQHFEVIPQDVQA
jgi:nitrite reductase/ring-hydroxylating ferredoxin subunit